MAKIISCYMTYSYDDGTIKHESVNESVNSIAHTDGISQQTFQLLLVLKDPTKILKTVWYDTDLLDQRVLIVDGLEKNIYCHSWGSNEDKRYVQDLIRYNAKTLKKLMFEDETSIP